MERSLVKFTLVDAIKTKQVTDYSKYSLVITPPSSTTHTLTQTVNDSIKYKVPKSGVVKLELIPSYYNYINGVYDFPKDNLYKVELYSVYQSLRLDQWYWLIPPPQHHYSYSVKYNGEPIKLISKLHEPSEISPEGYFLKETFEGVEIDWQELEVGTEINIKYRVAYTLASIESYYGGLFSADQRRTGEREGFRWWW